MPYIKKQDRSKFTKSLNALPNLENPGELNYLITKVCQQYIEDHKLCYNTLNEVVGALECCKIEFYRRVIAPYEGVKIAENGDLQGYKPKTS
jgi:hypothetical protein